MAQNIAELQQPLATCCDKFWIVKVLAIGCMTGCQLISIIWLITRFIKKNYEIHSAIAQRLADEHEQLDAD